MADGDLDMKTHPTEDISVSKLFGIDSKIKVKGFAEKSASKLLNSIENSKETTLSRFIY